MMRDKNKDLQYFTEYVEEDRVRIEKFSDWLASEDVKPNKIPSVKMKMFQLSLQVFIAQYSMGKEIVSLKDNFLDVISYFEEGWKDKGETPEDFYHFDDYVLMLWMLSIGVLLDISVPNFERIVAVLRRSKREDYLFEYLIHHKLSASLKTDKISYPKQYSKLVEIINSSNMDEAAKLITEYLFRDWYKHMKSTYWYNKHKKQNINLYFGYWCFEAAAISKIQNINNELFINNQYFPKDLI